MAWGIERRVARRQYLAMQRSVERKMDSLSGSQHRPLMLVDDEVGSGVGMEGLRAVERRSSLRRVERSAEGRGEGEVVVR